MKMNTRTLAQIFSALILQAALLGVLPHAFAQSDTTGVAIVGTISEASDVSLVVNGLTVDISQAQIDATLTLAVGELVQVEGALQADGSILADTVSAPQSGLLPGEVQIVGLLTSLDATAAVVNGIVFDITAATVDPTLLPGAVVSVIATPDPATDVWAARELMPAGADVSGAADMGAGMAGTGDVFHLVGTLDEIGDGYIVVAGVTLDTTNAQIDGMPLVGALVSVKVQVVDGVLVAVEVEASGEAVFERLDEMYQEREQHREQEQEQEHARDQEQDREHGQGQAQAQCRFEVHVSSANLRSGPGTGYDAVGYALEGESYAVAAVDATGAWVQVQTPMGAAWVAASLGELDDCPALPVSDMPFMGERHDNDQDGHDGDDRGDQGEHRDGERMGEDHAPGYDDNPMGDDDGPCSSCDDFMGGMGDDDGHDDD